MTVNSSSPYKMPPLPGQPSCQQQWGQPDSAGVTFPGPAISFHGAYSDIDMQDCPVSLSRREQVRPQLNSWVTDDDGPYVPRGAIPDAGFETQRPQINYNSYSPEIYSNSQYPQLEAGETDSIAQSYMPSDSGYGSFNGEHVYSADKGLDSRSSLSEGHREELDFGSSQRLPPLFVYSENRKDVSKKRPLFVCECCNSVVKTRSELKKHMYRHEKPFKCDFPSCGRSTGFSTVNDLERHKRSKHPSSVTSKTQYRCVATPCKSKDKLWPRLDNFRSHLKRMHSIDGDIADGYVERGKITDDDTQSSDMQACQTSAMSFINSLPIKTTSSNNSFSSDYPQQIEETYECISENKPSHFKSWTSTQDIAAENTINQWSSISNNSMNWNGCDRTSDLERHSLLVSGKSSDLKHILNDSSQHVADSDDDLTINSEHNQTKDDEKVRLMDMIERLRAEGYTIEKRSLSSSSEEASAPKAKCESPEAQGRSKKQSIQVCKICHKFQGRPCELKKHMKRHDRPYGCTFPNCEKAFGSKNDWKRHEVSQHQHPDHDQWKCSINNSHACAKVFSEIQGFKQHLLNHHQLSPKDELNSTVGSCCLGAKNSIRFWCGFCRELVDLKSKDAEATSERFNHIDDHFMGRGNSLAKRMKDWLPLDANASAWEKSRKLYELQDNEISWQGKETASRKRSATECVEGRTSKSRRSDDMRGISLWRECCDCGVSSPYSTIQECCEMCNSHRFCDSCRRGNM